MLPKVCTIGVEVHLCLITREGDILVVVQVQHLDLQRVCLRLRAIPLRLRTCPKNR